MADTHTAVDGPEDFGEGDEALVKRWMTEIGIAEKEFKSSPRNWFDTGDKIVKRYRDERTDALSDRAQRQNGRFNILWANVQLLQPTLYNRTPSPEVARRFKERDPVARAAAGLLERGIAYCLDIQDFDDVMNNVVQDRLLPGRGVAWVRYVPNINSVTPHVPVRPYQVDGEQFDDDGSLVASTLQYRDDDGAVYDEGAVKRGDDDSPYVDGKPYDEVISEKVVIEYVFWKDFLHNPVRNWGEVRWVSRKIYMTRTELRERFGTEIGNAVPLDFKPKNYSDTDDLGIRPDTFNKAVVHEIWDKGEKKALWICEGYEHGPLDEKDDPLGLENFFPCPKPLYATTTTDTLVPVADYVEYQDQAEELDLLTSRMKMLMGALKLSGLYNAAIKEELQKMLDSSENSLIPVDGWAMFSEKGGIAAQIEYLPLKEIAATLLSVAQMRDSIKQDLYELTGISDIMRGSSNPNEPLGTQKLKGRYGNLRLKTSIDEVQRIARDLMRIVGEIVAEQFAPETIREIAGMEMPSRAEVAEAKAAVKEIEDREDKLKTLEPEEAQAILTQAPMPDKAEMDHIRDIASDVPFEDAIELLQDQGVRTFRLDIETDSTIAVDEREGQQDRIEFLNAASGFMKMSAELGAAVPEYVPLLGEMLMFGLRGFKAGRRLEDSFEDTIEAIRRRMERQQEEPRQDPRMALMMRREDREDRQQKIDATTDQAEIMLKADRNQIDAEDDRTGHEIEREKMRKAGKLGEQELARKVVADMGQY